MLAILAALALAAAPQYDTVYTEEGGRLVGTVIEETPQGVSVQLPDGTTRRLERREVARIEYADGSVSTPNRPAPPPPAYGPSPSAPPSGPPPPPARAAPPPYRPPPPYAPPPPPVYTPGPPPTYRPPAQEPPPAYATRQGMPPIVPVYGVFGIGGAFMSGEVRDGVAVDRVFGNQLDIWLEGGLRLNPHLALGLYIDAGVGGPSREVRDLNPDCDAVGLNCSATTARVGLLLRHTFDPSARSTPWIAVGTGFDFGSVDLNEDHGGRTSELFSYSGWEMLRLMAGVDLRSNPVFGVGLYGGVAVGRYSRFESASESVHVPDQGNHTTISAGLRFTLFP